MICIGILLYRFLNDFGPKLSGKAPNEVIMGDKYSQTPYSDFWTDYGTNFCLEQENTTNHGNVQGPKQK